MELFLKFRKLIARINQGLITKENYVALKTELVITYRHLKRIEINDFIKWLDISFTPLEKRLFVVLDKDGECAYSEIIQMTTISEFLFCNMEQSIFALNEFIQKPETSETIMILDVLKVILNFDYNTYNNMLFYKACFVGNLELAKYLWKENGEPIPNIKAVLYEKIIKNNQLNVLKWLDTVTPIPYLDCMKHAVVVKNMEIIQWLSDKPGGYLENNGDIMYDVIITSSFEIIRHFVEVLKCGVRIEHIRQSCFAVRCENELEIIKYLFEKNGYNPAVRDDIIFKKMVNSDFVKGLDWLYNLAPFDLNEILFEKEAIQNCSVDAFEWLLDHDYHPIEIKEEFEKWITGTNTFIVCEPEPKTLKMLKLLQTRHLVDIHYDNNRVLYLMAKRQCFEVVNWILDSAEEIGDYNLVYTEKNLTALSWVCKYKRLELAKRLYSKGFKISSDTFEMFSRYSEDSPFKEWIKSVESTICF
jgi:hypothetical protein